MDVQSDNKLRVGVVGPAAPPAGGMAAQTEQLCRLLDAEGVRVLFLQTNAPYCPQWIGRCVGVRALARLIQYVYRLWQFAGQVDVVHVMANSGWSWQLFAAPAIWVSHLKKTPVIVNYRGGEADAYLAKSQFWVRPTLKRASSLVVPSRFLHQVFSRYGFDSIIVPNIIDTALFKPAQSKVEISDPVQNSEPVRIISVRNLEPIYDIETTIRAFYKASLVNPHLHLSIAGSGPDESKLKKLVNSLELGQKIDFVGRLGREEIRQLYATANILINSSVVDNMPNSLLEAMASGVAIISTDAGGIPWVVEHEATALLSPARDSDALAANLCRVLDDHALATSLRHTALKQAQQYDWSVIKEQWLSLYRRFQPRVSLKVVR